jgi:hypothetical protein
MHVHGQLEVEVERSFHLQKEDIQLDRNREERRKRTKKNREESGATHFCDHEHLQ